MPMPGRKPKPTHLKVNQNSPVAEWTSVPNVPYTGPVPVELPETKRIMAKNGPIDVPLLDATHDWWEALCRMPHCVLWEESDWHFALVTAIIADAALGGISSAATELRTREKVLGTTVDFRRGLRIRYVDANGEETEEVEDVPGNVMDIESYRDL